MKIKNQKIRDFVYIVSSMSIALCLALGGVGCAHDHVVQKTVFSGPLNADAEKAFSSPMLQLSADMHWGGVEKIDLDAIEVSFLTCSHDKTAKLWRVDGGRLVHTFRPPAEQGKEGTLYACALSPDGKVAALGGRTKANKEAFNIYLFNTQTNQMVQRLSGFENTILDLEFRRDGILAASISGINGIRVFQPTFGGYRLIMADPNYGGSSFNLAFDPYDGRLVTLAVDGHIRIYSPQFELIQKVKTVGGSKPFSLSFSPDGRKIAVGFKDSNQVDVYDARNLTLQYQPDVTGITMTSRLHTVLFGTDGSLYAGGMYSGSVDGKWWSMVRQWENWGEGPYRDFKAAGNTISDLKRMSDGSFLMAGHKPDIARYRSDGSPVFYESGDVADFRNADRFDHFSISADGAILSFKPGGQETKVFDLNERKLITSEQLFERVCDHTWGIQVSDWNTSYSPKINRKEVPLEAEERSLSVDIGPGGTIVMGTDRYIYAFNQQGEELGRVQVPVPAWAVKVAKDGRTIIAAHETGQIRWYRMSDGKVLLSLFIHADGKRWVLYSPEGYYDTSPGAENLLGWHVNNGSDRRAEFVPLWRLSQQFYRPDIVTKLFHAESQTETDQILTDLPRVDTETLLLHNQWLIFSP